ncbi:hypothetical protein ABNF97_06890 [Plantactinospora sp. B6F1]
MNLRADRSVATDDGWQKLQDLISVAALCAWNMQECPLIGANISRASLIN